MSWGCPVQGLGGRAWPPTPDPLRGSAAGFYSPAGPASLLLAATTARCRHLSLRRPPPPACLPACPPACPPAARAGSWIEVGEERRERGREAGRRAGGQEEGRQAEREEGGESEEGEPVLVGAGGTARRMLMRRRRCIGWRTHPQATPSTTPCHRPAQAARGHRRQREERQGDLRRRPCC